MNNNNYYSQQYPQNSHPYPPQIPPQYNQQYPHQQPPGPSFYPNVIQSHYPPSAPGYSPYGYSGV